MAATRRVSRKAAATSCPGCMQEGTQAAQYGLRLALAAAVGAHTTMHDNCRVECDTQPLIREPTEVWLLTQVPDCLEQRPS